MSVSRREAEPIVVGRPGVITGPANCNSYGQVAEIIFTLSTLSVGPEALDDAAPEDAAAPAALEAVPVISTLWPTCGLSFASSPLRRYSLATDELPELAPAVPAVPAVPAAPPVLDAVELAVTFLNTNLASPVELFDAGVADEVSAVPLVPVAALSAR